MLNFFKEKDITQTSHTQPAPNAARNNALMQEKQ